MTVPNLTSRLAGALLAGCLSVTLAHAQATIDECEKIQAADAYNQCLAKFGPPQKSQNLEPERPGDVKGSSEEAAAGAEHARGSVRAGRHRRGRGATSRRGSAGRKRLVISVKRRRS